MGQERGREPTADASSGSDEGDGPRRWTTAERTTLIVSILIIVGLIGIAVVELVNRPAGVKAVIDVQIEAEQAEQREDVYAIPFTVTNSGGEGANEVTIRFEVMPAGGDEVVDTVTITIDVLPVRGVEDGELLISHDPATHTITGRAVSYLLP